MHAIRGLLYRFLQGKIEHRIIIQSRQGATCCSDRSRMLQGWSVWSMALEPTPRLHSLRQSAPSSLSEKANGVPHYTPDTRDSRLVSQSDSTVDRTFLNPNSYTKTLICHTTCGGIVCILGCRGDWDKQWSLGWAQC